MRSHTLRWARIGVTAIVAAVLAVSAEATTKVTIGPGITLDSLARKYDVPKADIARANGISVEALLADGRILIIPDAPPVVRASATEATAASIQGNRVAIRRGPGVDYLRVALLDDGAGVTVTARKGEWRQIRSQTVPHGWIRGDFLAIGTARSSTAGATPSKAQKTASAGSKRSAPVASGPRVIKGDRISIRTGASTTSKRLTLLDDGAPINVRAKQGDWCKVRLADGRTGWVLGDYVATRSRAGVTPTRAFATQPKEAAPSRRVASAASRRPSGSSRTAAKTSSSARTASKTASGSKSVAASSGGQGRKDVVRTAYAFRGTRYRYGGASRGGFDCSGLTSYVYAKKGVSLPHNAAAQFKRGQAVSKSKLKEGDLVFFHTTRRGISHVGMYIGDGKFVHASSARGRVRVDSLNSGYYSQRYRGARRVK